MLKDAILTQAARAVFDGAAVPDGSDIEVALGLGQYLVLRPNSAGYPETRITVRRPVERAGAILTYY